MYIQKSSRSLFRKRTALLFSELFFEGANGSLVWLGAVFRREIFFEEGCFSWDGFGACVGGFVVGWVGVG